MPGTHTVSPSCPKQQTLLLFPLRRPEIESRRNLCQDPHHEATQYLQDRPEGFIFMGLLKRSKKVWVGLFQAVGKPNELVVIKKMVGEVAFTLTRDKMTPSEVMISSMTDPLVRRQLPLNSRLTTFPRMLAFQIHRDGPRYRRDLDATLVYKYYNGGTLFDLVERYKARRQQIPEGFIWHVILLIAQTLSYLHTGRTAAWAKPEGAGDRSRWTPIVHFDAHLVNIWLHYPTAAEKEQDPRLGVFTESLPQVILGDYGYAFQADRVHSEVLLASKLLVGLPERETWGDKAYFGAVILHMLFASDRGLPVSIDFSGGDVSGALDARAQLYQAVRELEGGGRGRSRAPRALAGYSRDLLDIGLMFEPLTPLTRDPGPQVHLRDTLPDQWNKWPANKFVYRSLVAMAIRFCGLETASPSFFYIPPLPSSTGFSHQKKINSTGIYEEAITRRSQVSQVE
ncbi:hypothetical protein B0T25DRAFT_599517 [Lasiosphaeria hispida]|uniref:Protein kinase domain-containing protein n=1 Tax=Lasiosphaeria hispida TaxID=260671 RepID=A0AAJ0MH85_9PEZI|nr:hypothetical protein B0T25DRAFT_599517 [Lasiosphaeria hispida]